MKARFVLLLCIASALGASAHAAESKPRFSPEVVAAAKKTYPHIRVPNEANKEYRDIVMANLLGCYQSCMTPGAQLNQFIAPEKCDLMCVCDTHGLIQVFPKDFVKRFKQTPRSKQTMETQGKVAQACIAKHKKQ